ncbi:MAG: response regulator transcription factor [Bacteroidota bacterium]
MSIPVAILEDDTTIRETLSTILNNTESVSVLASFDNSEDFIVAMDDLEIEVAIIDINLPNMNGIECIFLLKKKFPSIHFLIFTVIEDDEKIFDALCAGATGYLLKNSTPQMIVQAIIDIKSGGSPMTSSIARKVVSSFSKVTELQDQFSLTTREKEILICLEKGLRYKEIAFNLSISMDTVRSHIRNIYEKLQVQSRTDALNKYYKKA